MSLSKLFPCFQFRMENNINKLDYSNNILSESFPQVWQYERTLEELNVMSTRINYFPPQLFYCQGLKVLLANNNSLESIPEAIGSLRQLQQLNLSRNFISNVPDNIKSCKHLTHLDLSCNTLQKLPDAITCLISLQELILNETYLEFLPANFGRLVNLRIVELRTNNLISLPKSIQRLTNLQRLDIGCNEFTKLPEVIGELKQLRELWFDFNQIQDFPNQIGKLRELVHCDAHGNCLSYLPNEIGNCRNLEVLTISINNLTALPFSIGMLKSLVTLKCESNELTELPSSISNLENLEELVVSHNKLIRLPNTIGMLRKLRYLFADDNNLRKLPDEICSCSVLSVLSISRNKIAALPDNIGHLTNLKVLNIVQNNIATLPVTLLSLVNLTSLWISNNQSQPLIPLQYADISKKTQLTCFMLPQLGVMQAPVERNNCISIENNVVEEEQLLKDAAISKRRIWFAEETTILRTNPEIGMLPLTTSTSISFNNDKVLLSCTNSTNNTTTISCNNKDLTSENSNIVRASNFKDFLMRSPTPYPKELRLMAKYVHVNNAKTPNNCNNHNQVIFFNENRSDNKTSNQSLQPKNCPEYWSCNTSKEQPLGNISEIDKRNIQVESNFSHENIQSYIQQRQRQDIEIEKDLQKHTENSSNLGQQFVNVENIPKPPPYHIARCFTKKSVDDLTKYEFVRKRQEQNHNFHCFKDMFDDNSQLCLQTGPIFKNLSNKPELNFDFVNNLMVQKIDQKEEASKSEEFKGAENTLTSILSKNELLEPINTLQRSNIFPKTKNRSRTKWLFGAHRNPRVIQVNINLENGRDFEIDILPNKEGIFVVSTSSESNASQLIQPFDKLLEVDGVDFTNISVNEARQVLDNSRPLKSIMLSRK
ncbi:Protein lap1 [Lucilia cuprina]|uniref:Protein lap1 n=1 Tax=Lucilia cuprina TaxID=7375 RepID=A0A0L0BNN7_LUCCU|nr:Protein lap1 [Lucilia cuprina]KNC20859.1 Protein lap1 [Lucilia cuprina]